MRFTPLLGLILAACATGASIEEAAGERACEFDFTGERLGGVHYLLSDADADGAFEVSFPGGPEDTASGTWDGEELSAVTTYEDGYRLVSSELEGAFQLDASGDASGSFTLTQTFLDGWVQVQEQTLSVQGCTREVLSTGVGRSGDEASFTSVTTFTGPDTAELERQGTSGTTDFVTTTSVHADFTSDELTVSDDPDTEADPDSTLDRHWLADGSGEGSSEVDLGEGRVMVADWAYLRNGDSVGDWEIREDGQSEAVAWGTTWRYLDTSGRTELTQQTAQGPTECTRVWDAEGHGSISCDNGYAEEF